MATTAARRCTIGNGPDRANTAHDAMNQAAVDGNTTPFRAIFAGICALVLTVGLARFAYTPMLPIMKAQAGLDYVAAGWLAAINYAGYMAGTLLAATAGDLRRKYVLYRIGLVVAVASTVAMGLTRDPVAWGALRFLSGLSSVAGLLLASGLVLNWLLQHGRRPDLGLHFTGMGLGIVVSGAAVVLTLPALTWSGQWIALGVLGLLFFVPAWLWMPAPASTPSTAVAQGPPPPATSSAWTRLLNAAYVCAGFGFVIGATFIVAILEKLPVLQGRGGWVWVVVGVAALPSTFVWDRIARRFGAIRALLLAYVLQGHGHAAACGVVRHGDQSVVGSAVRRHLRRHRQPHPGAGWPPCAVQSLQGHGAHHSRLWRSADHGAGHRRVHGQGDRQLPGRACGHGGADGLRGAAAVCGGSP